MTSSDAYLAEKLKEILKRLYPNQRKMTSSTRTYLPNQLATANSPTIVYGQINYAPDAAGEDAGRDDDDLEVETDDPWLAESLTDFIKILKMSLNREQGNSAASDHGHGHGDHHLQQPTVTMLNSDFDLNLSAADIADLNDMMSDSEEAAMPLRHIIILLAYLFIATVAIFGNLLVVQLVIKSRRLHTLTHVLLANLAVADLMMATINIPFSAARIILKEWPFGSFLCHLVPFLQVASVYAISYTMTVIALDRYQVIMNPLGRRMKSSEGIPIVVGIWILSILLSLPYALHHQIVNVLTLGVVKRCQAEFDSITSRQFLTVGTFLLQYLIPLFLTTISYVAIMRRLHTSAALGSTTPRQAEAQSRAKIKTIKMLMLTVIFFAISWAPINIYHVLTHFGLFRPDSTTILICHMIAMSSSCYNPYIYCWLNEHFRMEATRWTRCFRTRRSPTVHPGLEVNGMLTRRDLTLRRQNQSSPIHTTSFRSQLPVSHFPDTLNSAPFRPELIFITTTSTSRSPSPPSVGDLTKAAVCSQMPNLNCNADQQPHDMDAVEQLENGVGVDGNTQKVGVLYTEIQYIPSPNVFTKVKVIGNPSGVTSGNAV